MKKLLLLFVTVIASLNVWADDTVYQDESSGLYFIVDGLYATITNDKNSYSRCSYSDVTSVEIPSVVYIENTKYTVTAIGKYAFYNCSATSIVISEGVTSIGEGAFYYCTALTSIELPESLISIGDYAFRDCEYLTSVIFHEGLTTIGNWAFMSCYRLVSIVIPESVTTIGLRAFACCYSLTSVFIEGDTMPTIYPSAFTEINPHCILYVSKGLKDDYWYELWNYFLYENIVEIGADDYPEENYTEEDYTNDSKSSSINSISNITNEKVEVSRYNLQGQLLSEPTKGINIIRYSDGTVKKVLVK